MNAALDLRDQVEDHRAAALDAYANAVELHRETVELMVGLVLDIVKIPRGIVAKPAVTPRGGSDAWDPTDERIVLGALISGTIGPSDLKGLPPDAFRHVHGPIAYVLLGTLDLRAAHAYRGRGLPLPVVRWALGVASRVHPELRGLGAYVARLAREAPKRQGALAALGRLTERGAKS